MSERLGDRSWARRQPRTALESWPIARVHAGEWTGATHHAQAKAMSNVNIVQLSRVVGRWLKKRKRRRKKRRRRLSEARNTHGCC